MALPSLTPNTGLQEASGKRRLFFLSWAGMLETGKGLCQWIRYAPTALFFSFENISLFSPWGFHSCFFTCVLSPSFLLLTLRSPFKCFYLREIFPYCPSQVVSMSFNSIVLSPLLPNSVRTVISANPISLPTP